MKISDTFFTTKRSDLPEFDLESFLGRKKYFEAKAGTQILEIKEYLNKNTFIAFLLAKKGSGKGTYTKLITEIFGEDLICHISVGDVVRKYHKLIQDAEEKIKIVDYLSKNYRGYITLQEALDIFENKSQGSLLPTEFIIALVKKEIEDQKGKAYFIDGFPRGLDQIPYSLFFKELIDLRNDPDIFVTIDTPEELIRARIESRVVCPKCQTPRNLRFLPTNFVAYDSSNHSYYLMCDNLACNKERLIQKDGDGDGIESIRERLNTDGELMDKIKVLHGVQKINLSSTLPIGESSSYADSYEITKEYVYSKKNDDLVFVEEQDYSFKDDSGDEVHTLLAPAVVVQFLDKLSKSLFK
jgi:adenylate kinase family enzyme